MAGERAAMSLPWVRLDSNIASNPKIAGLLATPMGAKAFVLYVCALGYCGGHGTDGFVPQVALPFCHGTPKLAAALVLHGLWEPAIHGWQITNWADRQVLTSTLAKTIKDKSYAGKKGGCAKNHAPGCECWKETG